MTRSSKRKPYFIEFIVYHDFGRYSEAVQQMCSRDNRRSVNRGWREWNGEVEWESGMRRWRGEADGERKGAQCGAVWCGVV